MMPPLNSVHLSRASDSHKTVINRREEITVSNWLISSKDAGDWGESIIGLTTQFPYLQKCLIHLATSSLKSDPGKTIPFDMQGWWGGEEWQGLQRSEMLRTQEERSVFRTGLVLVSNREL